MTVGAWIANDLFNCGLWPEEAKAVIAGLEAEDAVAQVLHKEIEGYPDQFKAALSLTMRSRAKTYLKEHKPEHFALGILEQTS